MMRDDFAVMILTHGRADRVYTLSSLRKGGYTGKVFLVLDNEDDQHDEYVEPETKPTTEERVAQLEAHNETLLECLLEMSEIVYA